MTKQHNISPIDSTGIVKKYGDFTKILKLLHPAKVQNEIIDRNINSNKLAYTDDSIRLSQFTSAYTKDNTYKILELWLFDLSNYLGVKEKLSVDQIQQLAVYMYSEAYCLNFTELALFFNRIKKGCYGDFYGAVDPLRIMSFLQSFMKDRYETIERINEEKDQEERKIADLEWIEFRKKMTKEDYEQINQTINNFIKQMKR